MKKRAPLLYAVSKIKKTSCLCVFAIYLLVFGSGYAMAGWITLDMPGYTVNTMARGIDGSNIVGSYDDASGTHGFLYNGTNWTTFDMPGASETCPSGIDGSKIVGRYYDASGVHGFFYNGSRWTTLDMPGAPHYTDVYGIDGSNIVGNYEDVSGIGHFFYIMVQNGQLLKRPARSIQIVAYPAVILSAPMAREVFFIMVQTGQLSLCPAQTRHLHWA
jgi:hypothetical protein